MKFRDGEKLPCYGGPKNGKKLPVVVAFPFLKGGVHNSGYSFGSGEYWLDKLNRRWVWTPAKKARVCK